MKKDRHQAILKLLDQKDIETQEELVNQLQGMGFRVTQATISRDIKELHLIKVQSENGTYKYAPNEASVALNMQKMLRVVREAVIAVKQAGNFIVVQTLAGSANAAAEVIDNLGMVDVVGSIAGDNTIFIATMDNNAADRVLTHLKKILQ